MILTAAVKARRLARIIANNLIVLLFIGGGMVCAQPVEPVKLETLKPADGLSSGIVTCMLQDSRGFMWFGTVNGLNRFDGYKFTVYKNDPAQPASLTENYITALFEDAQGRMFVGTVNGGLDIFDRVHQQFHHLGDVHISKVVRSIVEDKYGTVWVTRGSDIYQIGKERAALDLVTIRLQEPPLPRYQVTYRRLAIDRSGQVILFGTNTIYRLESDANNNYHPKELTALESRYPVWQDLAFDSVRNKVLLMTPGSIIAYADYSFTKPDTLVREPIYNECWGVDKSGAIWYLTKDGMKRKSRDGTTVLVKTADPLLENFLKTKTILYWDRNGNLWLSSSGYGIAKYNPGTSLFSTALNGTSIHDVVAGKENDFYVGWTSRISIGKDQQATVRDIEIKEHNNYATARDGLLWTVYGDHISRTNANNQETRRFPFKVSGLSNNKYCTLNFDNAGRLWMAFWYCPFLASFDTTSHEIKVYHFPQARTQSVFRYVQNMLWDSNQVLWMNTMEGLFSYDQAAGSWRHFPIGIARGTAIHTPFIALANDPYEPGRYLWIGTNGQGLWKLDKTTGAYKIIDVRKYIPDNTIYSMLEDDQHFFWLSSSHGLTKFNTKTTEGYTYDKSDGLQDNEFNWSATAKLSDGTLAFGGIYGINYFQPSAIRQLPSPQVVLTGLKLFNKQIKPGDSLLALKQDISYSSHIALKYKQNVFTLEFAALEYYKLKGVNYRYKLEGFDADWVYAGKENSATYTNLDIGSYNFFVEASYSGSGWRGQPALLSITVTPPWWKTWWFYSLCVIIAACSIYALYLYRIRQLLKVERLRIRIAQDLHDEIGSTLSTLSIYSRILQQELPGINENATQLLENIDQNASQVMDSVSDIVWSINTRYDNFESITNRMREHASAIFENRECKLHYNFDESLSNLTLPMDDRKNFYLIYKEALNNVSKYALCSNLWISLDRKHHRIQLSIRDDGKGFIPDPENSGNGIHNMHDRAAALGGTLTIDTAPGHGTHLLLIF